MLHDKLDNYIYKARKERDEVSLKVFKLIKTEFIKYSKTSNLDEISEAKILLKMFDQWKEECSNLFKAGRDVSELTNEIQTLKRYVPEIPTEEEVEDYTRESVTAYKLTKEDNYKLSMRDMKPIMLLVKEKYPLADGSIISKVLKSILK